MKAGFNYYYNKKVIQIAIANNKISKLFKRLEALNGLKAVGFYKHNNTNYVQHHKKRKLNHWGIIIL